MAKIQRIGQDQQAPFLLLLLAIFSLYWHARVKFSTAMLSHYPPECAVTSDQQTVHKNLNYQTSNLAHSRKTLTYLGIALIATVAAPQVKTTATNWVSFREIKD